MESVEERFRLHTDAIADALQRQSVKEVISLLRDIASVSREYRDQPLIEIILPFKYIYPHMTEHPEVRSQLLKTIKTLLQYNPSSQGALIRSLAVWVEDDDFEEFLKKYSTLSSTTMKDLRLERYSFRKGHWKELMELEQMNLLSTLSDLCCDAHMWHIPCGVSSLHTAEYLSYVTHFCLNLLHSLNMTVPTSQFPVSGDGEPDMFAAMRIHLGIHLAGLRVYNGDREGAYTVLEDIVSLLEKLMEMSIRLQPEQTHPEQFPLLTCRSPAMQGLQVQLCRKWFRVTERDGQCYEKQALYIESRYFYSSVDIAENLLYYLSLTPGAGEGIYFWLDPLKEEEWYRSLTDRVRACIRTRPILE